MCSHLLPERTENFFWKNVKKMKPQEISIPVIDSLINLVRNHKCIWCKASPGYKDTLLKRHAYELIFQGLQTEFSVEILKKCDLESFEDVKKKIKTLMNTRQQHKRKMELKSGAGATNTKPWIWFEALSFLDGPPMAGLDSLQAVSKLPIAMGVEQVF